MNNTKLMALAIAGSYAILFAILYTIFGFTLDEWDTTWWPQQLRFMTIAFPWAGPGWIIWNNTK